MVAEPARDFGDGEAADRSDERDRNSTSGTDSIDVRQVLLSEHDDADAVARIQRVGGMGYDGQPWQSASGAGRIALTGLWQGGAAWTGPDPVS